MNIKSLIVKYQSIGWITSSLLVGAIVTFIALPFLTRFYSVHDFGQYGVALALVSILSTVANLRLDQAQLVAKEEDQKKLIFEGGVVSFIFCLVTAGFLTLFFDVYMIISICVGVFSNSLLQSLYNYKFSQHSEKFCAVVNVLRSLIVVICQLSLPIFFSIKLINSYAISSMIIMCFVLLYIVYYRVYAISWNNYKNYKDFIFSNTPHALLNSFSHNLPYYIVSHFIGYHAVGFYSIVERSLRIPINLISQTVRQFYILHFNKQDSSKTALKISILFSLISFPFFALIFILPESLYLLVFGQEWIGISMYFKILALGYWAIFCNPPSSAYIIAKRKSSILFKLQIIELIFKFLLFFLLYSWLNNPLYMLFAVPISLIFYNSSIIYFVWREK